MVGMDAFQTEGCDGQSSIVLARCRKRSEEGGEGDEGGEEQ